MSDSEAMITATKRRPRTVASLSHQEIQHKRDLDRRAQRAYRQRTKTRIQDLESDLSRMRASRSQRENDLLQELQTLRDQNRHLKACLQSIGRFALGSIANDNDGESMTQKNQRLGQSDHSDAEDSLEDSPWLNDDFSARQDLPPTPTMQSHNRRQVVDHPAPDAEHISRLHDDSHDLNAQHIAIIQADDTLNTPKETFGMPKSQLYTEQTTRSESQPALATPPSCAAITPAHSSSIDTTVASIMPKLGNATCPLDQILLDFISSRRALLARGMPVESVVGPETPSVKAILYPHLVDSVHIITRVISEIMLTFSTFDLPEKLALVYKMHLTLRWQISPTPENYARLPKWLRPTLAQIAIPHAAWIENIPWPQVRDMLIENPEKYPFSVFSELYSHNVSINWPFDAMDAIIHTDDGGVVLNPIYEKHIQRLSNWTVQPAFETFFPEMRAALRSTS